MIRLHCTVNCKFMICPKTCICRKCKFIRVHKIMVVGLLMFLQKGIFIRSKQISMGNLYKYTCYISTSIICWWIPCKRYTVLCGVGVWKWSFGYTRLVHHHNFNICWVLTIFILCSNGVLSWILSCWRINMQTSVVTCGLCLHTFTRSTIKRYM